MSIPTVRIDPGENLKLVMRRNRDGEIVFRFFTDTAHLLPHLITDNFEFNIKKSSKSPTADILSFTSVGVAPTVLIDEHEIRIPYDEDESDLEWEVVYFELKNVTTKKNWFQGPLKIITGEAPDDAVEDVDVTLTLETVIEATVSVNSIDVDNMTEAQVQALYERLQTYLLNP